jgi:Holliday junction resolvasome RuvABC endonuclease subunit
MSKGLVLTPGGSAVAPPKGRKPDSSTRIAEKQRKTLRRHYNTLVGADISSSRLAMVALTDPPRVLKVNFRTPWVPEVCLHAQSEAVAFCAALANQLDWDMDVWIESALVGRNVRSTIVQSYVNGAVQAGLLSIGSRISLVTPGEWKLVATGNGAATKEQVARRIQQRWPHLAAAANGDEDTLDAFGIALYGASVRGVLGKQSALS